jgi:hypothetical protein
MNVCPVCEAPATAQVCDVCGHAFAQPPAPPEAVAQLQDLDVLPAPVGAVPLMAVTDLEPTRFAPTAAPADDWSEDEWERTSAGKLPDVMAGGLAELETGREAPTFERTAPTLASVTCRYCRNVQQSGLLCERCGMHLPWSARAPTSVAPTLDPDVLVRCGRCGERTYQRERCSSCGGLLTRPE